MYEQNTAGDLASQGKSQLKKVGERMGQEAERVESNLAEVGQTAVKKAERYYEDARNALSEALDVSIDYARKHPVRTAAGAAALGFLLGFVSRRR